MGYRHICGKTPSHPRGSRMHLVAGRRQTTSRASGNGLVASLCALRRHRRGHWFLSGGSVGVDQVVEPIRVLGQLHEYRRRDSAEVVRGAPNAGLRGDAALMSTDPFTRKGFNPVGDATTCRSIPGTWVTVHSGDMDTSFRLLTWPTPASYSSYVDVRIGRALIMTSTGPEETEDTSDCARAIPPGRMRNDRATIG